MNHIPLLRIRLLTIPILCVAVLIISKLYLIQIVKGEAYAERADRQYVRPFTNLFDRGSIFFTTKDGSTIAAAGLKSGFIVAINPGKIKNPYDTYVALKKIIKDLDYEVFLSKASKESDPYEEIARRVEPTDSEKIEALGLPGVYVYKERWRYYPGGKTASHLIGFLSYNKDTLGAFYGLESSYDTVLNRDAEATYANFFTEILSGIKKNVFNKKSLEGDIVLTIEPTVQGYLEQSLEKVNKKFSSEKTGGIIIDPTTGDIFALAIYPTYDPNDTSQVEDISDFSNPMVENVYEMGSIVKPLTVAAGLDAKVIKPESTYDDKGSATYDKSTVSNFDKKPYGITTIQNALGKSLNIGMAHIVGKLGKGRFVEYFYGFGLHEKTGIDLPNEAKPLTENLQSPRDIEAITASFGQGIAVTPIGIVRALSTLANGGNLIEPHVVRRVDYKIGISNEIAPEKGKQVIKPETSEEITRMLVKVVDNDLLEGQIKNDRYAIAAKTGTAQIARTDSSGYYEDRYLHSFFGYFPAYKPRFLVFLFTYYPKGVDYASHTLTEPFKELSDFLVSYYNVPPDR